MGFATFSLVTIAGSAIWCYVLAYLGDEAFRAEPKLLENPEAMMRFIKGQSHWLILVVVLFASLYLLTLRLTSRKKSKNSSTD